MDIFVTLPVSSDTALLTLAPIYEYLTARGCKAEGEHVVIADWPVQFLVPGNTLEEEALAHAHETDVDGIPTRIVTAEHLVAIALNTGRPKDFARILQFLEQRAVNESELQRILVTRGLAEKWDRFRHRYLGE